nr:cell wall-binding repeat-containing protein [Herbiconiux sp. VKM Ac-1786]
MDPSDSTAEIPSDSSSLHVLLPEQASGFAFPRLSWVISGAAKSTVGTVALPLGTTELDLDVPAGFFAGGASLDAEGRPYFDLDLLGVDDDHYLASLPTGSHSPGGEVFLELRATIRPVAPSAGSPAGPGVLDLDESRADTFEYSQWFWADPVTPLWLTGGDSLTVSVPAAPFGAEYTAQIAPLSRDWSDPAGPIPDTPVAVSAGDPDPSGAVPVAVTIPSDFDTAAYLARNSTALLTVSAASGDVTSNVKVRVRVADVVRGVSVTRVSGYDRFRGAAAASEALVEHHVDTVYLASGQNFADALSIAPVAAAEGRPVLLGTADEATLNDTITIMENAARAVGARTVVQVGGDDALPWIWRWHLGTAGNGPQFITDQISGPDRFAVSREIALRSFEKSGAPVVFLATGRAYADALAAAPAATASTAPVVLIDGAAQSIDQATLDLLTSLRTREVVLVGGPAAITPGIESSLHSRSPGSAVTRYGGADRFAVAEAINAAYFPDATSAYLASGASFPDALTGGVVAAAAGSPLYLSRSDCVPGRVLDQLADSGTTRVTLLGGQAVLSSSVAELRRCAS